MLKSSVRIAFPLKNRHSKSRRFAPFFISEMNAAGGENIKLVNGCLKIHFQDKEHVTGTTIRFRRFTHEHGMNNIRRMLRSFIFIVFQI